METKKGNKKKKRSIPPPPLPRFWTQTAGIESVTKQEIANYWMKKHVEEEDHLLAAVKAAARIRARNLTEEYYKQFEVSLKDDDEHNATILDKDKKKNEIRIGIKDWWTKSKYAYLNQPAMDSPNKRSFNYVSHCFSFNPNPLYPTSLGVF
ncbi:uncharacterized protein LOC126679034 [Mercurialis annua]|uniref:uncharacterized protein LOC126679034 n=1 Tax=Mercurialis annua TaxID=3986 RepID=UPI0021604A0D|nr:uncharacterized protein LOC126679034 [Mercurialis annua]